MASEAGGGASREEVARAMSRHGGGEPDMAAESSGRVDGVKEDEGWRSYESVFTNRKAGMDDVDRDWVKKVVYENSKNSPHFRNEQRKAEQATRRLQEMLRRKEALSQNQLAGYDQSAAKLVAELEATRDLSHWWFHVDMDAFYASCHELMDPTLAGVPMAVGGVGMISTANYKARKYGVRSAMPGFIALKLCPDLKFCPSDFALYKTKASEVRAILAQYDPNFLAAGLDESYLDVTSCLEARGESPDALARCIRDHVRRETGLMCSIGVACNRMLAKICSDLNKPNGEFVLQRSREAVLAFTSSLPVRKVPGIGKVTERILSGLGLNLARDLVSSAGLVVALFSEKASGALLRAGLGLGRSGAPDEDAGAGRKGISVERTFRPLRGEGLEAKLAEICAKLEDAMMDKGLRARHITVKMKGTDFVVRTKSKTLPFYTNSAEAMLQHATKLTSFDSDLRLIGVRMAGFEGDAVEQGQATLDSLFLDREPEEPAVSSVVGGGYFCETCKKHVAETKAEHEDWHLARSLQREVWSAGGLGASRKQAALPSKKAKCVGGMDLFVTKRPRKME